MSEREDVEALVALIEGEFGRSEHGCDGTEAGCAQVCPAPAYEVVPMPQLLRDSAYAVLASPWLRAHDDRIRAEALAPVRSVIVMLDTMAELEDERGDDLADDHSHWTAGRLRTIAAALRDAADTPTHDTTEEDADEEGKG